MGSNQKIQIYIPSWDDVPDSDVPHKVVQLRFNKEFFLLCGGSYHYESLESFLQEREVSFKTFNAGRSGLIPVVKGVSYEVLGAGYGGLFFDKKLYAGLDRSSKDYSIGINKMQELLLRNTLVDDGWTCI